jgi:hypothetical protein
MKTLPFTPIAVARAACKPPFKSVDALAKALSTGYPDIPWPAARSLSVKIGALDRGQLTWWKNRPAEANALVDILKVSLADLGLHGESSTRMIAFTAFPELLPFDPARDTPCDIASAVPYADLKDMLDLPWWHGEEQAGFQRPPHAGISWLEFAPGTGLSLFWASLSARTPRRHARVRKVSDATHLLRQGGALVLRLAQPCDAQDLLVLATAHAELAILIVAPFPGPLADSISPMAFHYGWELPADSANLRIAELSSNDGLFGRIARYKWRLHNDWHVRLLDWVEKRLARATDDTLFSAQGARKWLENFSPWMDFTPLPADLLAICRLCHNAPESKLPKAGNHHAGSELLAKALRIAPGVVGAFSRRIGARLLDQKLPWQGPMAEADWAKLMPEAGLVPGDADVFAIANGRSVAARQRLAQAAIERRQASLQTLIDAGLLTEGPFGMRSQPAFLVDLLARDHLIAMILAGPVDDWARCCFDAQRRLLVDAALHAIALDALVPVLARIQALAPRNAAAIAASDALFWNIGLRLVDGAFVPHIFSDLLDNVVERMKDVHGYAASLWSRDDDAPETGVTWLAICWAWSLWHPHKAFIADLVTAWYFPGWTTDLVSQKSYLYNVTLPTGDQSLTQGWRRLLAVARQLAHWLSTPPEHAPCFLHPALLLEALQGRWPVQEIWLSQFLGNRNIETWLLTELTASQTPVATASALLPVLMNIAGELGSDWLRNVDFYRSPVYTWALQTLPASVALGCLDADQRGALWRVPIALPPALLEVMLNNIDAGNVDEGAIERAIEACGPNQAHSLVRLIRSGHAIDSAVARLWALAPPGALLLLGDVASLKQEAAIALIHATPSEHNHAAAEAILANPLLLTATDRHWWVRANLPHAKGHAQQFIDILFLPDAPASV